MFLDSFGQDSKIIKPWEDGKVSQELPNDLAEFFSVFDKEPEFKVTIQHFSNESYTGRPSIIGEYSGEIPNYQSLVKSNGVGYYRYKIAYKQNNVNKLENIDVPLVSPNWKDIEREGEKERKARRKADIKEDLEEMSIHRAYGGNTPEKESLKDQLEGMQPILELIKTTTQPQPDQNTNNMMMLMMAQQQKSSEFWSKIIAGVLPVALPLLLNRTSNEDKIFNMAEKMLNIKNLVSPKEESLIDKIGNFLGGNLPVLMEMLAKPKHEREQSPTYQKVNEDWRTKKIKEKMQSNKEFAEKLINHLDGKIGTDTTDQLLEGFLKYNRQQAVEQNEEVVEAEEVPNDEITPADFED